MLNRQFKDVVDYYKANKALFEKKNPGLNASKKLERYLSIIKKLDKLKDQHAEAKQIYDAIAGRGALQTSGPIPEIEAIKQTEEKVLQTAPAVSEPDFTMDAKLCIRENLLNNALIRDMYKSHCQKYSAKNSPPFLARLRYASEEKQSQEKLFDSLLGIVEKNILMHDAIHYLIQKQGDECSNTFMIKMHNNIMNSVMTDIKQENDKIRSIPKYYNTVGKK